MRAGRRESQLVRGAAGQLRLSDPSPIKRLFAFAGRQQSRALSQTMCSMILAMTRATRTRRHAAARPRSGAPSLGGDPAARRVGRRVLLRYDAPPGWGTSAAQDDERQCRPRLSDPRSAEHTRWPGGRGPTLSTAALPVAKQSGRAAAVTGIGGGCRANPARSCFVVSRHQSRRASPAGFSTYGAGRAATGRSGRFRSHCFVCCSQAEMFARQPRRGAATFDSTRDGWRRPAFGFGRASVRRRRQRPASTRRQLTIALLA